MIVLNRISFNVDKPWKQTLDGLIKAAKLEASCVDAQVEDLCIVVLPSDDPRLTRLTSTLTRKGIDWHTQVEAQYEDADWDSAELLILELRSAHKGESGLNLGTEYDFDDACPQCGSGAKQRGPLIAKDLPACKTASMIYTIDGDVLVSPDVAKRLRLEKRDVRGTIDKRSGHGLEWVQLMPSTEMPRMDSATTGTEIERQCEVCKRDGHYHNAQVPFAPTYRRKQIKGVKGLAWTFELSGRSNAFAGKASIRRIADPQLVVSQSVRHTLRDMKIRGLEFIPVRILG